MSCGPGTTAKPILIPSLHGGEREAHLLDLSNPREAQTPASKKVKAQHPSAAAVVGRGALDCRYCLYPQALVINSQFCSTAACTQQNLPDPCLCFVLALIAPAAFSNPPAKGLSFLVLPGLCSGSKLGMLQTPESNMLAGNWKAVMIPPGPPSLHIVCGWDQNTAQRSGSLKEETEQDNCREPTWFAIANPDQEITTALSANWEQIRGWVWTLTIPGHQCCLGEAWFWGSLESVCHDDRCCPQILVLCY